MKKLRRHHVLFLLLICIVGLFGCSRTRIIDKISIIHVFGFDLAENGDILGTALFPDYTKSKDGSEIQYLEEKAPSGILFPSKMSAHTSTPVELAKIRVLLFGKEYAEAGIKDMVERLILNPQIGTGIQIAVSTHSARETLNAFQKEKTFTLAERIQQNMLGQNLPYMNLHVFLNQFFGEGTDAYVPLITIDEKDRVMVEGIGVFKDDKLKLQLNQKQTTLFSFLKHERSQAMYNVELDDKDRREIIVVRAFQSNTNWDWDQKKEQLNLRLTIKVTLVQYPNRFDIEKTEDVKKIKNTVIENLEKDMQDLLAVFKENGVDPVGIGNIVRSKDSTWEEESFYKKYPTLPIHVNVDLEIIHSGLQG